MQVGNDGHVTFTYPFDERQENTEMIVIVNRFAKDQPKRVLDEKLKFEDNAKDDILDILNSEMAVLNNLIAIEKRAQDRLPKKFRDDT